MGRVSSEKAPIRGLAKLLTNLAPGIRTKIENAFTEAENLLDFHNRSVISKQTRRTVSGLVDTPIVTVTSGVLGVAANWERLDDPRITAYEVEVSSNSIFSDPTSFQTIDTNFSLENRTAATYIRVRGIRSDGEAGPWSDVKSATPDTVPVVAKSVGLTDVPANPASITTTALTTIQEYNDDIETNTTAAVTFGSLSVDIPAVGGGESTVDTIVRLNGRVIANYGLDTLDQTSAADTLDSVFVAQTGIGSFLRPQEIGGFAVGFGPAGSEDLESSKFEDFPCTNSQESGTFSGSGTPTGWTSVAGPRINNATTANYSVVFAGAGSGTSEFLELFDFDFNIPTDDTIVGIEVHVRSNRGASGTVAFDTVQLIDETGTITGNNNSGGETLTTTLTTYTFGGPTDLWGLTLTPADINDSDFGFALKFDFTTAIPATLEANVTFVTMCVYTEHSGRVLVRIDAIGAGGANDLTINNATVNVVEFASENV